MAHRPDAVRAWRLAGCALAAVLVMGTLLDLAPPGNPQRFGFATEGLAVWRPVVPVLGHFPPLSPTAFAWAFRGAMAAIWLGWIALLVREYWSPHWNQSGSLAVVAFSAAAAAVVVPPVLSNDAFAYVAYARIPVAHGLNPYLNGREALEALGDPAAQYMVWSTPFPYGPLWILLVAPLAKIGSLGGLFGEVLVHKLLAGAGLLASAAVGGRVADRREAGRGPLTVLAIGLNPLLVLEGPGSGHTDPVMLTILLASALCATASRQQLGALLAGLSAAVKPVTLAVLPLLIVHELRGPRKLRRTALTAVLFLAPLVGLSLLFGGPTVLWNAVFTRLEAGQLDGRIDAASVALPAALLWGGYVAWRGRHRAAWLDGWAPVALVLALFVSPLPFPWYLSWALIPALTGWQEDQRIMTAICCVLAFTATWLYVVPA